RPRVEVIADGNDGVEIFAREIRVSRVEALRVVLAGGEGESERPRRRVPGWRRARPPGRTLRATCPEAVPVHPVRLEPADLRVHGMRELGKRAHGPGSDDVVHGLVAGHQKFNVDG